MGGPATPEEDTTMRFLMLIYPDIPQTSDEWMPSADTPGAAMGRYNKELSEAGVLLAGDGPPPPDRRGPLPLNGPLPTLKDRPVTAAQENLGGVWVIACASNDRA